MYRCLRYIILFNIHNRPNRQELISHFTDEEAEAQRRNLSQSPSGSGKVGAESQSDPTKVYMLSIILQKLHNSPLQLNNNICARHCNREIARKKRTKSKKLFLPAHRFFFNKDKYQRRQLRNTRHEYKVINTIKLETLQNLSK